VALCHRSSDKVSDDEYNDSADDGDKHAVQIETGHTGMAGEFKHIAADKRANHTEDNVEKDTRARAIYDFAGDKARDQPENDPAED
jgi:hypothetical protein